ncbi:DUF3866 family protein [Jatrophihabitans sp. YIM 134969]
MIWWRTATVTALDRVRSDAVEGRARLDRPVGDVSEVRVLAYPDVTGPLAVGDVVWVTVTALALSLGTGGYALVASPSSAPPDPSGPGHLVKARYLPLQVAVQGADEQDSPHHDRLRDDVDLGGLPVVVADLHSALPAVVAGVLDARPGARVVYVMTDGGTLPIAFSRTVPALGPRLVGTVTCGQAFGGTLECVSLHSALQAARIVLEADVVVVSQGPGNLGTGTTWGFSGVAAGDAVNAVAVLGGRPVGALRLSTGDPRPRHQGVSHHSLTAFGRVALRPADLVVPEGMPDELAALVASQLEPLARTHRIVTTSVDGLAAALAAVDADLRPGGASLSTMGRGLGADTWYFLAAAAAGRHAASLVR